MTACRLAARFSAGSLPKSDALALTCAASERLPRSIRRLWGSTAAKPAGG
jgi:hypothetical protein